MSLIASELCTEPQSNQANSLTALIDMFPVGTRPHLAVTRLCCRRSCGCDPNRSSSGALCKSARRRSWRTVHRGCCSGPLSHCRFTINGIAERPLLIKMKITKEQAPSTRWHDPGFQGLGRPPLTCSHALPARCSMRCKDEENDHDPCSQQRLEQNAGRAQLGS